MLLNLHDVDIKLLRVFQVVAKYKGITAAQSELNSAQPTISMQLAQLEARLGVVLCQRGQAGFKLTDEGIAVLESAEQLFIAIDTFKLSLADYGRNPKGELKFGVIDNLSTHPEFDIQNLLSGYRKKNPNVDFKIVVETSSQLEQMLMDGTLQLCISICERRLPSFSYVPLFEENHCLYCSVDHELAKAKNVSVEDIAHQLYVDWEYNEPRTNVLHGVEFERGGASNPYLEAIYWLLASGNFIGYLPDHFARQWVDKGTLVEVDIANEQRSMEIYLMTKKGVKLPSTVEMFVDMLVQRYGATPK